MCVEDYQVFNPSQHGPQLIFNDFGSPKTYIVKIVCFVLQFLFKNENLC